MPGTGNIPSAESVFGPSPENASGQFDVNQKGAGGKKRMLIIIGSIVIGVLVLFGVIILGISLLKPKTTNNTESEQQAETYKISEEVSKVMDLPMNATATYEQSLDFADVIVPTIEGSDNKVQADLEKLFASPVALKGSYKTDEKSDIQNDETYNGAPIKKTYIAADKSTYVFNAATNTWAPVTGDTVTEVSAFYPPQTKAALFYNTKVNVIDEIGEETIDGSTYRKMKIVPKEDIIKAVISGSSPLLAKTQYDSMNLDQLEIFAWVTEDNNIYKIAVNGSVAVVSDLYEGTVKITSSVIFKYNSVQINKP